LAAPPDSLGRDDRANGISNAPFRKSGVGNTDEMACSRQNPSARARAKPCLAGAKQANDRDALDLTATFFQPTLEGCAPEGRYPVFADLESASWIFPRANPIQPKTKPVRVGGSNDYLGMGPNPWYFGRCMKRLIIVALGHGGTRRSAGTSTIMCGLRNGTCRSAWPGECAGGCFTIGLRVRTVPTLTLSSRLPTDFALRCAQAASISKGSGTAENKR